MSRAITQIGPSDHGKRMSLPDFLEAEGREGYIYELGRGIIIVVQVPNWKHGAQIDAICRQLYAYLVREPDAVHMIAHSNDCKVVVSQADSERHPDLAIYKHPPVDEKGDWATWIPDIAVEVVSPGSEQRDYVEKREEYFQFGIREYWIIDERRQEMLALRRAARKWGEHLVKPEVPYETPLLPGFLCDLKAIFEAARKA